MTKHYLHVHPSIQQDAVDKFARAFARDKRPALDDVIQAAEKERKMGESHTVAGVCEKEVR